MAGKDDLHIKCIALSQEYSFKEGFWFAVQIGCSLSMFNRRFGASRMFSNMAWAGWAGSLAMGWNSAARKAEMTRLLLGYNNDNSDARA